MIEENNRTTYLSVCSGCEAAHFAFSQWECVGLSEIDECASNLLAHRFPHLPNHGDFTKLIDNPPDADVLVGGSPCQAFSQAGKRLSLRDRRGNLTLAFADLADAMDVERKSLGKKPILIFWENVVGVLQTPDNAFGCFLSALCGEETPLLPPTIKKNAKKETVYSWPKAGYVHGPKRALAWRCLDAQFFALPQKRRRIFVVAGPSEWGAEIFEAWFEFGDNRLDVQPQRGTKNSSQEDWK